MVQMHCTVGHSINVQYNTIHTLSIQSKQMLIIHSFRWYCTTVYDCMWLYMIAYNTYNYMQSHDMSHDPSNIDSHSIKLIRLIIFATIQCESYLRRCHVISFIKIHCTIDFDNWWYWIIFCNCCFQNSIYIIHTLKHVHVFDAICFECIIYKTLTISSSIQNITIDFVMIM